MVVSKTTKTFFSFRASFKAQESFWCLQFLLAQKKSGSSAAMSSIEVTMNVVTIVSEIKKHSKYIIEIVFKTMALNFWATVKNAIGFLGMAKKSINHHS